MVLSAYPLHPSITPLLVRGTEVEKTCQWGSRGLINLWLKMCTECVKQMIEIKNLFVRVYKKMRVGKNRLRIVNRGGRQKTGEKKERHIDER